MMTCAVTAERPARIAISAIGSSGGGRRGCGIDRRLDSDAVSAPVDTAAARHENHAPQVAKPIHDHTVNDAEQWTFKIPPGAFTDADGDKLRYTVRQGDGSALPNWLDFDRETGV